MYTAAECRHNLPHDGEPQTAACRDVCARGIRAVEAVKELWQIRRGGAYYQMQQAEASSAMERQYKNERIMAEADRRGMMLIDTNRVKELTAQELGKNVSEIDFYKIKLSVKDDDRKHRSYDDTDFRPIYKVKCFVGDVKYKLCFDAVSGDLLTSKVDYDDDDRY